MPFGALAVFGFLARPEALNKLSLKARHLLAAPAEERIKDKRDRAILSTLLYHAGAVQAEGRGFQSTRGAACRT